MPTSRRPNIVMLVADDQRFDTVAALGLGSPGIRTPNLDALARDGVAFTGAHLPGGTHGAVCMPSRAMFLTSRTPFHLENCGATIPAAHRMLPECFANAGYHTHAIGKWHNGRESFVRCFKGGDEIFFGGMVDHWNVPVFRFDPTGRYESRMPVVWDPLHSNKVDWRPADHVTAGVHSTDLFATAAEKFIRGRAGQDQPFFLYTAFLAPHDPRTMPEHFRAMYSPDDIELPANFLPEHPFDNGDIRGRDESLAGFPRDPGEIRRHIAEYYAMITHLDEAIGRIRAALEAAGEWENTIFLHMADHGLAVGQHGLMGKQDVYDHSIRVPLLMAGPGLPRGLRRDGMVCLMDVYPTLCELAGITAPADLEGRSLCPMIHGEDVGRDRLYLVFSWAVRGIKIGRHKLIEYHTPEQRGTQVFDLGSDPLETINLADDGELLGRLRREMVKMRDEWGDMETDLGRRFWTGMEFA